MNIKKAISFLRNMYMQTSLAEQPIVQFQLHMFKHVIMVCLACCTVLCLYFFMVNNTFTASVLLVANIAFIACYLLAKFKDLKLGTSLFLMFVTATTCLFMWLKEGLFDEAILAFPGFLIFAVLISSFSLAKWLFLFVSLNILAIGYVNEYGIYVNALNKSDLDSAIIMILILGMVSLSVYLASRSTQKLLANLDAENRKVHQSKQEILRLQNHDALTGLPNRTIAEFVFKECITIGMRENFETSLLFIDIDNFKMINDTYGHAAGDTALTNIAQRLSSAVRETDTVYRFGGDEFLVIATHEHHANSIYRSVLAEKLLKALTPPIKLTNTEVSLTVSIGIAIAPTQANTFEDLYKKADLAMYSVKKAGRNGYNYFNDNMDTNHARQLSIAQQFKSALENQAFRLNYQSIQQISTKKVSSAEALIRWQHPTLGELEPNEFIPIAEQSGFMSDIGQWVLHKAIEDCKSWHQQGLKNLSVTVNVSEIQFKKDDFYALVKAALVKYDLDGNYLILELSEAFLNDMHHKFADTIEALTKLGVKISIDDFGTGYSNLSYLYKADISILKIDRSFVGQMLVAPQDLAIVNTIVTMAKNLGLTVVAEGVENEQIQNQLLSIGCMYGQGFYWSEPKSSEEFISMVKSLEANL